MPYTIENQSLHINEGAERHSFGINDAKGREIGAVVKFDVVTLENAPEGYKGMMWSGKEAGTYFRFHAQATRDGESYGASQAWVWCKSESERSKRVEAYLQGAVSRAAKKAA